MKEKFTFKTDTTLLGIAATEANKKGQNLNEWIEMLVKRELDISEENPFGKLMLDYIASHPLIKWSAVEKRLHIPVGTLRPDMSRSIPVKYIEPLKQLLLSEFDVHFFKPVQSR